MEKDITKPHFETVSTGMFNKITKVEHKFLQALVESGGMLIYLSGEFTFFGYSSSILFKIVDENTVHLECISTPSDNRRQGSASSLMKAIADIAENTKTKISLTACNVTGNGWMMMQHLTISHGMSKQNKIPVAKLKSWYEKFGFKPIEYSKKHKGWNMEFIPSV